MWVEVLVVVGSILVLILSLLVPLMFVCLMCHVLRKRRKTFMSRDLVRHKEMRVLGVPWELKVGPFVMMS